MRCFKLFLFTISLICLWTLYGYADSLYTWIDDKGVTHLSQDPPPPGATLKDIVDYTSHPEEQNQADKIPEKKPKKVEPDKIKAEAEEVLGPEIYYEDGSDTSRSRRKARKKKRMENGKNKREDDNPDKPPEKVKDKQQSRKSRR